VRLGTNLLGRRVLRPLAWGLLRLHRGALRRPRLTLALAAGLLLALATQVPHSRIHLSIREMADAALPSSRWQAAMEKDFGAGHGAVLLFSPRAEAFTPAELLAIRSWVELERGRNRELVRVASPFDALRSERIDGRLRLVPIMAQVTPEALGAVATSPWGGLLTDRAGRDVAVELVFRDTPGGSRFGRFDPRPIGAVERRCRAELLAGQPGIQLRLSGNAAFDHFALLGMERFQLLNLAVSLLLLALLRLLLGTWRSGLLLVLVVVWAGAAVYGAMAASGVPIDLLSTGLFLMFAVAAVEDFLFVSWEQLARGASWRQAFRRLLLPGFLTSVTTVVGFGSLCVSELEVVRRFGFFGGLGAGLEWVATFLVLPALLRLWPGLRTWTAPARALGTRLPARFLARRLPRRAGWALLLLLGAGGLAARDLEYADTPVAMFDPDHPFRRALDESVRTRGWLGQLYVVFPEDASMAEVAAAAAELRAQPGVVQVLDPATVLASLTGGDPLGLFELAAERDKLAAGSGALQAPGGRLRASVLVADASLPTLVRLRDWIAARWPDGEGYPAGELISYADVGDVVPRTLMHSLLTCLGLVALVIVLVYRGMGLGWGVRAALASAWGPALTLLAMWALRLPVNLLSVAFASVLVGLTGDNAVQFACSGAGAREGIERRGGASVLVAVVMALGALVFLGSTFVPPRRLGLLLAGGLLAALVGDVWIFRALLGQAPAPGREVAP
jgi:predicted RND superfamily exporter protein